MFILEVLGALSLRKELRKLQEIFQRIRQLLFWLIISRLLDLPILLLQKSKHKGNRNHFLELMMDQV
jgi:hypothetical protein